MIRTWPGARTGSVNRYPLTNCHVLSKRKPRLWLALPGSPLLRFADRQFLAPLSQLPPRMTRFVPEMIITPFATNPQKTAAVRQTYWHDSYAPACSTRTARAGRHQSGPAGILPPSGARGGARAPTCAGPAPEHASNVVKGPHGVFIARMRQVSHGMVEAQ